MTDADKSGFSQAFNFLAVALRLPPEQSDAATKRIYWEVLCDLELAPVQLAAQRIAKTAQFFPKASEWRAAANIASIALIQKALPPNRDEPWTEECASCNDTGWEERMCYPGTLNTCGRPGCKIEKPQHRYVSVCACRSTNRTWQRHHCVPSGEQQYSDPPKATRTRKGGFSKVGS